MFAAFKRAMRRLTPAEMAARELAEAELELLEAQSGREYAEAMVSYHQRRISRLKGTLAMLQTAANDAGGGTLQRVV